MNVGMGNIGANNLPQDTLTEDFFVVETKFFDSIHESIKGLVVQFVDFVDFFFGNDESVASSFWVNIEKGEGFVIFVNFVAGNFAAYDFGKNTTHWWSLFSYVFWK